MRLLLSIILLIGVTACAGVNPDKAQQVFATQERAERLYHQGDFAKALPEYRSLVEDLPESKHSWLRLGNCYAQLGDYNQAVAAYQVAISLDRKYASAWINLSYVQSQILTQTVAQMYENVPENDPQVMRVRQLVNAVLEPFSTSDEKQGVIKQGAPKAPSDMRPSLEQ